MRQRICTLATCNLNQWALDFSGNLERIVASLEAAKAQRALYRVGDDDACCKHQASSERAREAGCRWDLSWRCQAMAARTTSSRTTPWSTPGRSSLSSSRGATAQAHPCTLLLQVSAQCIYSTSMLTRGVCSCRHRVRPGHACYAWQRALQLPPVPAGRQGPAHTAQDLPRRRRQLQVLQHRWVVLQMQLRQGCATLNLR